MMPIKTFVSERRAANLLAQIRCVTRSIAASCRAELCDFGTGTYRVFQRYLCKDCDRTFNDQTGTVFEHSAVALRKWFLAVYTYIRLNTSIRQLDAEIDVSYKTVYRSRRFLRRVDAPRPHLEGPVEIDEFYVESGPQGRERDQPSRAGLSTADVGTYAEDKLPVFVLADRGTGERHVIPAKAATESRIRLLLADRQQESLTVYTDGFRAYDPLDEDDAFTREYVVHGDGEYVNGDVHVNTCESTRRWRDGGSRRTEASLKTDSHHISGVSAPT
nr:hypothetical protein [Halobacterium salinarum]